MYVHWIRKDTAEDADLYEELRDAWDGIDYAGLPSFDDVLPDILEWVRGIRVADTVFNDYTYRASRLLSAACIRPAVTSRMAIRRGSSWWTGWNATMSD